MGIFNAYNLENATSTIVRVEEQSKNQIETGDKGKKRHEGLGRRIKARKEG